MKPKQLKKLMSSLEISQADLSRICFDQAEQSDRVIISRWLFSNENGQRWSNTVERK